MGNDVPRRNRLDLQTKPESFIFNSIRVVEAMGADERLTEAIQLLSRANELVSDVVDERLKNLG